MTTISYKKVACSICQNESTFPILESTNRFGSPDLDLRPPQMERSTMTYWVQQCPVCGYVASDISDSIGDLTTAWVNSEEYLNCASNLKTNLAKRFFKHYTICLREKKMEDAFLAILHAAWACDDKKDYSGAIACRNLGIEILKELLFLNDKTNFQLLMMDLLRRTEHFNETITQTSHKKMV